MNVVLFIFIPLFFCFLIYKNQSNEWGEWFLEVLPGGSYISTMFFIGVWPILLSYYLRYVILFFFVLAALKSYFNKPRKKGFPNFNPLKCLVISMFLGLTFFSIQGFVNPGGSTELSFPLKDGLFYIAQGGNSRWINHHFSSPAQKYAIDILQLDPYGLRSNTPFPAQLNDFHIYKAPVYSPCDGIIIASQDQFPDQELGTTDPEHPAGNFVLIKTANSQKILLAHLSKGSIVVATGSSVKKGDPIGQVGNSGNTSEPHLHLQCFIGEDALVEGEGIPMTFDHRFPCRNDLYPR